VLLEALACGTPIIASRAAGNSQQVLGYGRFGLLVDPLDIDGMAQAILYQVSESPTRPFGRAGDFSAAVATAQICEAITALLPAAADVELPAMSTRQA
jgi:glycosyltransferase involved in cell wall biosynthesis